MSQSYAKSLRSRFRGICNEYVVEFCRLYKFAVEADDIWVADDAGTIACISDYYFDFNSVIKYAVDNQLSDRDDLLSWYDYSLFAREYNQTIPNFESWSKGCPRMSKEEQEKLIGLKRDLEDAVKDFKQKY